MVSSPFREDDPVFVIVGRWVDRTGTDGNAVIYLGRTPLWATKTAGR
jgi:hypothetical protein